jgi:3-deoxy-D-manno-octulosonate 8-phosphate phosphatase (KDO 8-P phosphatase)
VDGSQPEKDTAIAGDLQARIARIELLLLDVDGVLTDGSINYTDDGVELKKFHVRDGSALKLWGLAGKKSAIISGRSSKAVEVRAMELGIGPVFQGASDKRAGFARVLAETGVRAEQVCCIGDDVPDLPLLMRCGLAAAVADACPEVRAAAHYVAREQGGRGAVREVIELLLRCQGHWQRLVASLAA